MLKNKMAIIIVAIFLIGVGILDWWYFSQRKRRYTPPKLSVPVISETVPTEPKPIHRDGEEEYLKKGLTRVKKESWGRDPFLSTQVGEVESLAPSAKKEGLLGIIYNEHHAVAIIGTRLVSVGDSIDGKWVIKIGEEWIIIKDNGGVDTLYLPEIAPSRSSWIIKEEK